MVFLLLSAAAVSVSPARAAVGEFSIPEVSPLSAGQLAALREVVQEQGGSDLLLAVRAEAEPLLDAEATPLAVIHYEGLVNTDPRRVETVKSLSQMADAARLMRYWQATGDERAAETLRRLILAWTDTYKLTGNDVNENKFFPLLVAYHGLRPTFAEADRERTDAFVERLGAIHVAAVESGGRFTNRFTKRVRLVAVCGMILGRPEWVDTAHQGVRRFVEGSLNPDGTSIDFLHRDTLTYHCSALKPVLELAIVSGEAGRELYVWENSRGGSLKRSVDFVVPYALGQKTHAEWVNSKVDLDRKRAEAGIEKYQPGRPYDPRGDRDLFEFAAYFDPGLTNVVEHLSEDEADGIATWQLLVNEAAHRADRQ